MKKRIAMLTAALMCLSAMPMTAAADEPISATESVVNEERDTTEHQLIQELGLPKTLSDYEVFIKKYGNVSVHGKYIVYLDEVNYSTGASVIVKQTGIGEIKEVYSYGFPSSSNYPGELPPPGMSSKSIYVYEAVSAGTAKFTFSQGRTWEISEESMSVTYTGYYKIDDSMSITEIEKSEFTETVKGDVNADGLFNIADVVLFRKWLLKVPGTNLANWEAADLHKDGKLDVFDFCSMKDLLIKSGDAFNKKITMNEIKELSKKGYDLTWSDFEKYQYEDIGSGLFVYKLEVENENHENIFLLVGGGSLDELPEYIRLRRCDNENKEIETIDIRSQEFQTGTVSKQRITMEDIVELSKKGYDLTWSDFVNYQYEDVGSGLYIFKLEVENENDEDILLWIGGGSLYKVPEYIILDNGGKEIDIRSQEFQTGTVSKQKITMEDIIELSKKGYDLTWSDFEKYQYEDIGSGAYVYKYEIEETDEFLLVGGSLDKLPEYIRLSNIKFDIRSQEFQDLLNWLLSDEPLFSVPEDDETNRANALKLGKYALAEFKKGNYNKDTAISTRYPHENTHEMMNEEMAELFNESVFYYLSFVDEHTVCLTMGGKGLLDDQGYLITDGSVEYEIGTMVPVSYRSYDGGGVNIYDADGDLYYFYATT